MFLQTGVGEPDEGHTLTQYDGIPGKNVQVPRELEPFDRFAPCTQRNTAPFVEGASHMPRPPQKVN